MADTPISGLATVGSVAGTNEFMLNEAGTEKKCSATQIAAFVSPAASDTVAGVLEVAIQSEQETGTDVVRAVSPGRQALHPSACKFWVSLDAASTTIFASYNVSSNANTGTGDADVTLTTAFSDANWCGIVDSFDTANAWDNEECQNSGFNAQAAGSFGILCSTITDGNTAACSLTDPNAWNVFGFGDQ